MLKKDESGDYICEKDTSYVCPVGRSMAHAAGVRWGDAIDSRRPKDDC